MGRTVTLRPNWLLSAGTYWRRDSNSTLVGGDWTYLWDNNDATYFYGIMSNVDEFVLEFNSYTLAGNERASEARLIQRISGTSDSFQMNLDSWIRVGDGNLGYGDGGSANYNGVYPRWQQVWNPGYAADWNQTAINALRAVYRKLDGVTTPAVSESYIDLWVQTQPTVAVTGPAWGSRPFSQQPTITWNYDAKGDAVRAYQVKVFTEAVVNGGGFNPDSSPTVWDSGRVGGAANSAQVGVVLAHGGQYRAYVRMATDYRGADWWSGWSSTYFIINSPSVTSAVTVTPASPITTTNRPTIGWTYSDPDSDAQEHYYIRVFPESVYSQPGFTPHTDAGTAWNSGTVADSGARSAQTGPLSPNVNYKAWVYTTDAGSGTRWSVPAESSVFIIQTAPGVVFDPPGTADVSSVTTDQANQRLAVTFGGRGNMLTRNQASIDTGTLGWENIGNGNLDRVTASGQFLQGGGALRQTSTWAAGAALDMTARSGPGGTSGMPVVAGRTYTALGSSKAATVARSTRVGIRWYDSTGTQVGSDSWGAASNNATGAWGQRFVTAEAPVGAAYAQMLIQVTGTATVSEAHWWDNLSFAPGVSQTWTRGGLALERGQLADSFTRANSATTLGTADVGGAWTAWAGTWGIDANRAYLVSATEGLDAQAVLTSGYLADGYVEVDIALSTVRAVAGLVFKGNDASNYLMVEFVKLPATDAIYLYKRVAGVWTQLASVGAAGLILGSTYKVRVEFYGGQVYVYVNDVQRITYLMLAGELNQFGSYGKFGIRLYRHSTGGDDGATRLDNFKAGLLPTQRITLERSLDGGTTWERVRNAVSLQPPDQQAIVYDYEVPAGVLAQYRAGTTASEAGNEVVADYSAVMAQSVALTISTWWLKDAVDPSLNTPIKVAPPFAFTRKETMTTYDPVGREESVFVSDGAKGIEGNLNVWCHDRTTYDKLEAILGNGRALLLQDPLGRSWWVKFGQQDWELLRAQPQLSETSPIRHFHGLSLPFVQVGAPAVV